MKGSSPDIYERSLEYHQRIQGKIAVANKLPLTNTDDLSLAYSPGVAAPCTAIAKNPERVFDLTGKQNFVAIVSDGSAVLGLGNIGPEASIPVMEGKAMLFKEFAGIDAWPICLKTQDPQEIIETVQRIEPVFGGINLEDISAPRCFEIEAALQNIGIPVFHDDQHGTAIVLLAALINAGKVVGKDLADMRIVINGAGAAGTAIARLLRCIGHEPGVCSSVRDVIVCDSKGAISRDREGLSQTKLNLLEYTNQSNFSGTLNEALDGVDVFIGVSVGNVLNGDSVRRMADNPIILAMANPTPEIMPEEALAAGAAVIGTGRSDYPNQVNNVLVFPGIFRGALNARASKITDRMKIAAARALAESVTDLSPSKILPSPLNRDVAPMVAKAVEATWLNQQG